MGCALKKDKEKPDYEFLNSLSDKIPFNCVNCRKPLYALTKTQKRATCTYILPIDTFKTLANDPDNIIFMGTYDSKCQCDCKDRWKAKLENRIDKDLTRAHTIATNRFNDNLRYKITGIEITLAKEYLGIVP